MSSQSIVIKSSFKKVASSYSRAKTSAKVAGIAWIGSMLVLASSLIFTHLPIVALLVTVAVAVTGISFAVIDWRNETAKWTSASDGCSVGDSCGNDECAPDKQGSCASRLGAERDKAILKGELERLAVLLGRQGVASYIFLGIWGVLGIGLAVKSPNSIATVAGIVLTLSSIYEIYILRVMRKISSSI